MASKSDTPKLEATLDNQHTNGQYEDKDNDDLFQNQYTDEKCEKKKNVQPGQCKSKIRKSRSSNRSLGAQYKFACMYTEDHRSPIYCVQFNHLVKGVSVFACVGTNRVSVYECLMSEKLKLLQVYADPDETERFFTCAWSCDDKNYEPLLAVAGLRGIIRILSTSTMSCVKSFIGHSYEINEVKFHPTDSNLLLSASKDHSLRLWNIKTDVCIVIFGGVEGHRDGVLSVDFDMKGDQIISCGMDHALKLWKIDKAEVRKAVKKSYKFNASKSAISFPTYLEHFPDYSTRDVHTSYVDCVRWFGDFIISKSCDDKLKFWKPRFLKKADLDSSTNVELIHELACENCDLWFLKFSMDYSQKILALGNRSGKILVWKLDVPDPASIDCKLLAHPRCISTIRHTGLNRSGSTLVAVCDDGSIWRWERVFF